MKYLRIITPVGWVYIVGTAIALFVVASMTRPSFLGFKFDPFKIDARKIDELKDQVSVLEREATGNAEIAQATQTFHTREVVIRDLSRQADIEARNAPDAETPLDPDRVDRIRSADHRLCSAHPTICPDPDAAGDSSPAL